MYFNVFTRNKNVLMLFTLFFYKIESKQDEQLMIETRRQANMYAGKRILELLSA